MSKLSDGSLPGVGRFVGYVLAFVLQHHIHIGQCQRDASYPGDFSIGSVQCAVSGAQTGNYGLLFPITSFCCPCQGCMHCLGSSIQI